MRELQKWDLFPLSFAVPLIFGVGYEYDAISRYLLGTTFRHLDGWQAVEQDGFLFFSFARQALEQRGMSSSRFKLPNIDLVGIVQISVI
ncbi:hypothetical protein Q3G72_001805 [Acer saccharum]|nr:hypothetical protein Q3G72_001805 [Acer saccharum]